MPLGAHRRPVLRRRPRRPPRRSGGDAPARDPQGLHDRPVADPRGRELREPTRCCSSWPRCPTTACCATLHELAGALGLAALVEAHDESELDRALDLGARVVGVNARDLGTFGEDLSASERLAKRVPAGVVAVAESAIRSVDDARRMAGAGYDAVLVGEALGTISRPERARARPLRRAPAPRGADMQFNLPADAVPTAWFNVDAGHARAGPAAAAPGDEGADRSRRPGARSSRWR